MNPELGVKEDPNIEKESYYQEIPVKSFYDAVNTALQLSYIETEGENKPIALVDIDGVILDDKYKIPFVCHRHQPYIPKENKKSFLDLVKGFEGSVGLITNRGSKDNPLWNTGRVISKIESFIEDEVKDVEIFKSLLRQFPFLGMGDTEEVIEYLGKKVMNNPEKALNIYGIEDWSFVSLNRRSFYDYLSQEIYKRCGGILRVTNIVVKK
jgi:hypothetical protein